MEKKRQHRRIPIEIIFIFIIVVMVVGNFFFLNTIAERNSISSKNLVVSRALAQEGIEAIIQLRTLHTPSIIIDARSYTWNQLFDGTITPPSCLNTSDLTETCADFIITVCDEKTSDNAVPCIRLNTNSYTDASWKIFGEENQMFSRKIRITNAEKNVKNVTSFIWWTDATGLHNSPISRKLQNTAE